MFYLGYGHATLCAHKPMLLAVSLSRSRHVSVRAIYVGVTNVHLVSLKEDGLFADGGIKLVRQCLTILLVQESHILDPVILKNHKTDKKEFDRTFV